MKLINDQLLLEKLKKENGFRIGNFGIKQLQHTSYYFRLGSECKIEGNKIILDEDNNKLTINPNSHIIVESYEEFEMDNKTLAIFGNLKDVLYKNIEMKNSLYIDPLFKGKLLIVLYNFGNSDVSLFFKEEIGKVSFFDVSDTNDIKIRKGSSQEKKFNVPEPYIDDDLPRLIEPDEEEK